MQDVGFLFIPFVYWLELIIVTKMMQIMIIIMTVMTIME